MGGWNTDFRKCVRERQQSRKCGLVCVLYVLYMPICISVSVCVRAHIFVWMFECARVCASVHVCYACVERERER